MGLNSVESQKDTVSDPKSSVVFSYFVGIDVGKTGGWAILTGDGSFHSMESFKSYKEFKRKLEYFGSSFPKRFFTVLEQVSAMPGQGVTSMFSFGQNYGGWQALLEILEMPYQLSTPQKWQKAILGTFPKGQSKDRALAFVQRRWPELNLKKKDHGIVDALCIALYARELHLGLRYYAANLLEGP